MTRTPRRLALAAGAALLLLTGCGDNGEARPGAAAVVGDTSISTNELSGLVERGLASPQAKAQVGADRAGFQRQALGRLINTEVREQAAADKGVTVGQGAVDAQRARLVKQVGSSEALLEQAAAAGIAAKDLDFYLRALALDEALGDALTEDLKVPDEQLQALYTQNLARFDQVRARHILVADEATARKVLAEVTADPSRFKALAAELSIDTGSKDKGGELGLAGRGQYVPEFENALFAAKPGDVVLVQTQFGWHVVQVEERQTTTFEQAKPDLRRAALQEQRDKRSAELIAKTAARLGVTVNPRFGAWDAKSSTVVPTDNPSGVVSPGPSAGSAGAPSGGPGAPSGQQPPAATEPPAPSGSPAAQ